MNKNNIVFKKVNKPTLQNSVHIQVKLMHLIRVFVLFEDHPQFHSL